jgi:oligopeptide/dipeptide ABC transporter ATP-binding protein
MSLLVVQGLSVRYRQGGRTLRAVDDVSFTVGAGETLALVGESGCGKTTTALAILRLLGAGAVLEARSVQLAGRELTTLSEREMQRVRGRHVGMVFQEPSAALDPLYTVGEQVAEGLRRHEALPRAAAWRRAVETLAEVGVPDAPRRAGEYPHQLSGGLRQRAMIAAAIACRPALLIADEPTTALDVSLQAQILDLFLRLREQRRLSILLITHDLGIVAEMAHRVAVFYAGQVVEVAGVRELFASPRHPYTRALLALLPSRGAGGRLPVIDGAVPDPANLPAGCRFAPRCRHRQADCEMTQQMRPIADGHQARCIRAGEDLA